MKRIARAIFVGVISGLVLVPATSSSVLAQQEMCVGLECPSDVLFVADAEVLGSLSMVGPTRFDTVVVGIGGPNGGQCFEKAVTYLEWNDVGGYFDRLSSIDPCGYEVVCYSHRVDEATSTIGGDDEHVGQWMVAMAAMGEDVFYTTAAWSTGNTVPEEPEVESMIRVAYCRAYTEGVLGDGLGGPQLWGVTYTPSWEWVPLVDEIADPVLTADYLWTLIEDPEIEMGSAPPFERTTFVRAPNWVWLEDGSEPEPVASMNPSETAVLMVRAVATETTWDFGESPASVVTCTTDQLVEYNGNIHDGTRPGDYGACSWTYLSTCFDDTDAIVNSQCGTNDGYELTVTITFEGEQALVTRANTDLGWPDPLWEPFAASEEVTSSVFTVPVREILSLNG